jgi:peptidoglycan/xylan/chitin deacetylase (PgdA/CDA1 family)
LAARCAATRTLVLSYDDGPGGKLTPELLDLLAAHEAKATFFLLGARAAEHPDLVDRLVAEGHETGCHTQRHLNAWEVPSTVAIRDLHDGYGALARWIAPDATFRPPYGKLSLPVWLALRRRGARLGWWTVDSGDTHPSMPDAEHTLDAVRRAGGGVVLMHDFDRDTGRGPLMLKVTEALLRAAPKEGWNIRPLRALFGLNSAGAAPAVSQTARC